MEHHHAVGERRRLLEVVRHEHDRDLQALAHLRELALQAAARHLVHRRERLVEQQHLRVARERPRERDALLLAAGELARQRDLEPAEVDELEQLARRRGASRAASVGGSAAWTLPVAVRCGNSA